MMPPCNRAPHARTTVGRVCALLALCAAAGAAHAGQDNGAAPADFNGYKALASHGSWTLFLKRNSLDIWRGNAPYEKMKNGHGSFVIAWSSPITLALHDGPAKAQSAAISYIFSCSPPVISLFDKVVFLATPFVPRNETVGEQWSYFRSVVTTYPKEEKPDAVSWRSVFDWGSLQVWSKAWDKIYAQACAQ